MTYEDADLRFLVARAGGKNTAFSTMLQKELRPHRRQIDRGTLSDDKSLEILRRVYSHTVVKRADVLVNGVWEAGKVPTQKGLVPFSASSVEALFRQLPDLFSDVQAMTRQSETFQKDLDEEDEGNSEAA